MSLGITCHYSWPIFLGLIHECNMWIWIIYCATLHRVLQLMNMLWQWGLRVNLLDCPSLMTNKACLLHQWVLHQLLLVAAHLHGTTKVHGALPRASSLTRYEFHPVILLAPSQLSWDLLSSGALQFAVHFADLSEDRFPFQLVLS